MIAMRFVDFKSIYGASLEKANSLKPRGGLKGIILFLLFNQFQWSVLFLLSEDTFSRMGWQPKYYCCSALESRVVFNLSTSFCQKIRFRRTRFYIKLAAKISYRLRLPTSQSPQTPIHPSGIHTRVVANSNNQLDTCKGRKGKQILPGVGFEPLASHLEVEYSSTCGSVFHLMSQPYPTSKEVVFA